MIFVLIGLVILVASFAIALVSLAREQRKHVTAVGGKGDRSHERVPPVEPLSDDGGMSAPEPVKADLQPVDSETVPFPWEQNNTQDPRPKTHDTQGVQSAGVMPPKSHIRSFSIKDNPSGGTFLKDLTK